MASVLPPLPRWKLWLPGGNLDFPRCDPVGGAFFCQRWKRFAGFICALKISEQVSIRSQTWRAAGSVLQILAGMVVHRTCSFGTHQYECKQESQLIYCTADNMIYIMNGSHIYELFYTTVTQNTSIYQNIWMTWNSNRNVVVNGAYNVLILGPIS